MLPVIVLDGFRQSFKIEAIADQSPFVRASITGVVREAIITPSASHRHHDPALHWGAGAAWVIIAISIPLSILCSICVLSALGETINIIFPASALAVGILVITTSRISKTRRRTWPADKPTAVLPGLCAQMIMVPAFVSTLCICIVFIPMFFLTGVARYLFVPLAEAVVFAMLASYLLSRTLVPTLAMYRRPPDPYP